MKKSLKALFISVVSTALISCTPKLPEVSEGEADQSTEEEVSVPQKQYNYKGKNVMDNQGSETGTITFQAGGGAVELQL